MNANNDEPPLDVSHREPRDRELGPGPLPLVNANDEPPLDAPVAVSPWRAPPAAVALAVALESMTTGHARILAEALRRMLER